MTHTQWIDEDRLGFLGLRGLETVAAVYDVTTGKTTEVWARHRHQLRPAPPGGPVPR